MNIAAIFYVGIGGALGSVLRYVLGSGIGRWLGVEFPYATMIINITGSFAMGLLVGLMAKFVNGGEAIRLFVAVGVLGGFTTFSAFSLEAISLLERHQLSGALIYVIGSVMISLAALIGGLALARVI